MSSIDVNQLSAVILRLVFIIGVIRLRTAWVGFENFYLDHRDLYRQNFFQYKYMHLSSNCYVNLLCTSTLYHTYMASSAYIF